MGTSTMLSRVSLTLLAVVTAIDVHDVVNNNPTSTWTAVHPDEYVFKHHTLDQLRGLMGLQLELDPHETRVAMQARAPLADMLRATTPLPSSFDARSKFGSC